MKNRSGDRQDKCQHDTNYYYQSFDFGHYSLMNNFILDIWSQF